MIWFYRKNHFVTVIFDIQNSLVNKKKSKKSKINKKKCPLCSLCPEKKFYLYIHVSMSEKKNRVGRPKKQIDEQDLLKKIDEYIDFCREQSKPILIEGFANFAKIGWTTFHERKSEFPNAYKKIRDLAKEHLLEKTLEGKYNATFAIFLAKNNYDMRDRQEIDNTGEFEIKIVREAK